MVLDGEERKLVFVMEIQDQVIVHDQFTEVIARSELAAQFSGESLRLCGLDSMGKEGPAGLWKPAKHRDGFIKKTGQEPLKSRASFWAEKGLDG